MRSRQLQDRAKDQRVGQALQETRAKKNPTVAGGVFQDKAPGDDLLLHGLSHTTIGAAAFHFRVRDGIGWFHSAIVTRERVEGRGLAWTELRARALVGAGRVTVAMLVTVSKLCRRRVVEDKAT